VVRIQVSVLVVTGPRRDRGERGERGSAIRGALHLSRHSTGIGVAPGEIEATLRVRRDAQAGWRSRKGEARGFVGWIRKAARVGSQHAVGLRGIGRHRSVRVLGGIGGSLADFDPVALVLALDPETGFVAAVVYPRELQLRAGEGLDGEARRG
jgi:hypothetical protein